MSVGRICTREVCTATANETVADVARRMAEYNVGCVVVLDEAGLPLSVVTDRDLVVQVLASESDPVGTTVLDILSPDLKTIQEDAPLEDALRLMRTSGCRRLPVLNDKGILIGIIALDDVLSLLAEEFGSINGILKKQATA
ncbi:MAG: CBS domain-containing protein [Oligoflexales bacterium]